MHEIITYKLYHCILTSLPKLTKLVVVRRVREFEKALGFKLLSTSMTLATPKNYRKLHATLKQNSKILHGAIKKWPPFLETIA